MSEVKKPLKVLFVEDDPFDTELVKNSLVGCETLHASCLLEAREQLASLPDVVLCDLHLPDGTGLDLLVDIRQRALPLPFILMTGAGDQRAAISAIRSGADDYLIKNAESLALLPQSVSNALKRFRRSKDRINRPLHVLYAEPNLYDIDLTREHLKQHAPYITIDVVREGRDVLKALDSSNSYDVLLFDFMLPDENALILTQELQRRPGFELPIVFVTGHGNEEIVAEAMRLGIADYIVKHPGYLFELPPTLENVTGLHRLQRERSALAASEKRFRLLAENARDIVYRIELLPRRAFTYVSPSVTRLTGYTPEEHYADADLGDKIIHPEDRSKIVLDEAFFSKSVVMRWIRKDGSTLWTEQENVPVYDESGNLIALEGIARDITERKESEERLDFLAHYDPLTRLPNRWSLIEQIERRMKSVRDRGRQLTLLLLDLDRFKMINESLGHRSGDLLLQSAAERLQKSIAADEVLARPGGDEFGILIESDNDPMTAEHRAFSIIDLMQTPFAFDQGLLYIGVSIGICSYPDAAANADELMRNAEAALYRAKDQGRNTYRLYTEDMTRKALDRLEIETLLREALANGELYLEYQPLVSVHSNAIFGAEALMRWKNPQRGVIRPDEFIPVAEESGMITRIGDFALLEACRSMKRLLDEGLPLRTIAVNISPRQFLLQDVVASVKKSLATTGLRPEFLELEITESALMQDPDQSLQTLLALRDLGIRLAIDDFGTGYSSLAHLKRFPLHKLKIDRSFIRDIPHDLDSEKIATTIVAMARGLELKVLAEGVETEDQRKFLEEHSCDFYQGYLCSPAVSAETLADLVKKQKR